MEIFNSLAGDWDLRYISKANYRRRIELIDLILKDLPKNLNILDYGCATGFLSCRMAEYGHRVIGADISEEMLKIARGRKNNTLLNVEFVNSKSGLFYQDNSFDMVVCLNTLEYTDNMTNLLKEVSRLIKIGGCLFISIPNTQSIFYHWQKKIYNVNKNYIHSDLINKMLYYIPYQRNSFDRKSLEDLLKNLNFMTTEVLYYSLPINSIHLNRLAKNSKRIGMYTAILFRKVNKI